MFTPFITAEFTASVSQEDFQNARDGNILLVTQDTPELKATYHLYTSVPSEEH